MMKRVLLTSAFVAVASPTAGFAQASSTELALEEIVVTAQKREQSLQEVPSAVSAISAAEVEDFLGSGENIRALAGRVPSLQIESSNGRQSPRFYIRGLGNYDFDVNATQPVSLIYDEVNLENSVLKSLPLFDVARVEVLKGPQGTLFGRSTTAGVVKVDSVKPTKETQGYVKFGYGSRETLSLEGAYGGAVSDTTAIRGAFKYLDRGDWLDNTINGSGDDRGEFDELSYRFQVLYEPSDSVSGLFKIHGFHQDGDQPQVFYANAFTPGTEGLRAGFDEETFSHDLIDEGMELDHFGASAKFEIDLANDKLLTTITSYDEVENFSFADIDGGIQGGPEAIGELGRQAFFSVSSGDGLSEHSQFTQEVRLSGQSERLFYQVGVYYLDEDITVDSVDFANDGSRIQLTQAVQSTTSAALFGQLEYAVNDKTSFTAGLRYTDDDKELEVVPGPGSFAPAARIEVNDDYFSYELAANYDFNEDWAFYTRLATASRGPVTLGRFGFTSQADTEEITSFEIGYKAALFDGRARWNSALYTYQIDDQQLTATGGTGNTNELLNAAKVDGAGFETEFEMLLSQNLKLSANLSYNDTEIKDPNLNTELCSSTPLCTSLDPIVDTFQGFFGTVNLVSVNGNPLPRAPKWLANVSLSYDREIEAGALYMNTDWNYRSDSNIFLYESVEFVAESRWIGGVRLGYRNAEETFDVALVGRNITNEIVADGALDFLNQTAFINEPRFWGIELSKNF